VARSAGHAPGEAAGETASAAAPGTKKERSNHEDEPEEAEALAKVEDLRWALGDEIAERLDVPKRHVMKDLRRALLARSGGIADRCCIC
jgi:DNA-directed RNA polymerase specialized sigma24 family protein